MGLAYQGKIEESSQTVVDLQHLIETHNYHCVEAAPFFLESKLYEFQRDWEAALSIAQKGQALYREHGHMFGIDNIEGNMIWAHLQLGNFAQARVLALGFGQRARKTGKQAELLYSLYTLGIAEIGLKNPQPSETYLTEALELAATLNDNIRRVFIHYQLGNLSVLREEYDQALAYFEDALQCAQTADLFDLQILARAGQAFTHFHQGMLNQARTEVESFFNAGKMPTPDTPGYPSVWLMIYQVLTELQDPRANEILNQLYNQINKQASKIKDMAQRATFLENISEHREIVAIWNAKNKN